MLPKIRIDGAVAEMIVIADLIKRGYFAYKPLIENTECDLVVDIDGKLVKIQIKSGHSDGEKIKVDLTRSSAKSKYYSKQDFDILAIYDSSTGNIAYLKWGDIPYKRSLTLRYTETVFKNGNVEENGRYYFNDYLEFPILSDIGSHLTDS